MTMTAIEAWRERVSAFDRDMEEIRGGEQERGHRRPVFASGPLDPFRDDDPEVNALYEIVGEGSSILDVGGGAGRIALPLATRAKSVTVLDPSAESLDLLKSRAAEFGFANVAAIHERWEDAEVAPVDVAICSLVLHHVLEAPPFVRKLEECAKDRVIILEMVETPGALTVPFYKRVYGRAPTQLPGVPKVLNLLWAMNIFPDVKMLSPEIPVLDADRDSALERLQQMLGVEEGSEADGRLRAAADDLLEETGEGLTVRGVKMRRQAIITWRPGR